MLIVWSRSSVWLERLPVTQEVASSSLVGSAQFFLSKPVEMIICFTTSTGLTFKEINVSFMGSLT